MTVDTLMTIALRLGFLVLVGLLAAAWARRRDRGGFGPDGRFEPERSLGETLNLAWISLRARLRPGGDDGPACVIEEGLGADPDPAHGVAGLEPSGVLRTRPAALAGVALAVVFVAGQAIGGGPKSVLPAVVEAPPEVPLAVSFSFTPSRVLPGEEVQLHLTPPFPVAVEYEGQALPAQVTNGGRTLVVRAPAGAAPGSQGFLALVANGRRVRADAPLEIAATPPTAPSFAAAPVSAAAAAPASESAGAGAPAEPRTAKARSAKRPPTRVARAAATRDVAQAAKPRAAAANRPVARTRTAAAPPRCRVSPWWGPAWAPIYLARCAR